MITRISPLLEIKKIVPDINKPECYVVKTEGYIEETFYFKNQTNLNCSLENPNLHRTENQPAYIKKENNKVVEERHYFNGELHNPYHPALIKYDSNIVEKCWYKNGIIQHKEIYEGSKIIEYRWYNKFGELNSNDDLLTGGCRPSIIEYYNDGIVHQYHKNGRLHRLNGTAFEHIYEGKLLEKAWYVDGRLHRLDGPALTKMDGDEVSLKEYYLNGKLHKEDGPAQYINENNISERWYINGMRHNENGPAVISTTLGGFKTQYWYQNDALHNIQGPAILRTSGEEKDSEEWYLGGLLHREDGPAVIKYPRKNYPSRNELQKEFYKFGKKVEPF